MNDREVYLRLMRVAEELAEMAEGAESMVGSVALQTAAQTISGTAQAVYDHCLSDDDGGVH